MCASNYQMFLLMFLLGVGEEETTNNKNKRVNKHIWCFDTQFPPAAVPPDQTFCIFKTKNHP